MSISQVATNGLESARSLQLGASRRIIENPADVDAVVDLKISERQVEAAVKLIQVEDDLEESLLDILA